MTTARSWSCARYPICENGQRRSLPVAEGFSHTVHRAHDDVVHIAEPADPSDFVVDWNESAHPDGASWPQ